MKFYITNYNIFLLLNDYVIEIVKNIPYSIK